MTLLAEGKIRALKASSNFAVAILIFSLPLGGCTSVGNTLGGLFGGDEASEESQGPAEASGFVFGGDSETRPRFSVTDEAGQAAPNLNTVPSTAPNVSPQSERDRALSGLIADRANARHSNQSPRSMPVAVRPLETRAGQSESEVLAPSVSNVAPLDPVSRLSDAAPTRPVEAVGVDSIDTASVPADTATVPVSTTQLVAGPGSQPINLPSRNIAGNGPNAQQTEEYNNFNSLSDFDQSAFGVSSQVASFPSVGRGLTSQDRKVLQELATLRDDVQGVLRVIGRGGPSSVALAVRVAEALRTLGVPADSLYVGADSTSGPVEVFLDY